MNPLDFTGPAFLVFYGCYGVVICTVLHLLRHCTEPSDPLCAVPMDPQAVAYLRGGATEAISLSTVTLLARGILSAGAKDTIEVSSGRKLSSPASALDHAVFEHFEGTAPVAVLFAT